jgi:flagella basal body P-ring formation protein FlgA
MIFRIFIAVCLSACLGAQERPCLSPSGDYILAKDLARAIPEFATVPASKILASAPMAGGKRIFRPGEIRGLAAQSGTKIEPNKVEPNKIELNKIELNNDVCFAWPQAVLNRNDVLDALRKSLNRSDANVEIIDLTTDRAPQGQLSFPLAGLGTPASLEQPVPVLWRGEVMYTDTRRFSVWARVRITAPVTVVFAVEKLEAGHPIGAGQVRAEIQQRFPALKNKVIAIDQIAGMVPTRTISPGAELRPDNLSRPNEVNRGDLVAIEARTGRVKLAFSGRAESAGHMGDLITVRNPDTQKIFQARVCAHDRAIVEPDSVQGNGYANESR